MKNETEVDKLAEVLEMWSKMVPFKADTTEYWHWIAEKVLEEK